MDEQPNFTSEADLRAWLAGLSDDELVSLLGMACEAGYGLEAIVLGMEAEQRGLAKMWVAPPPPPINLN